MTKFNLDVIMMTYPFTVLDTGLTDPSGDTIIVLHDDINDLKFVGFKSPVGDIVTSCVFCYVDTTLLYEKLQRLDDCVTLKYYDNLMNGELSDRAVKASKLVTDKYGFDETLKRIRAM